MPAGSRVRANNVFGLVSDNPLLTVSTTLTSAGLVNLPAISLGTQHAVITLDPLRVHGAPEIVIVTVHGVSSGVATITRGAYGTAAREHPQNTMWMHTPIDEDYIEIVTSSTRPTNPYEGQFIYETDTNKLVGYGGVDWASRDAGGTLSYVQVITPSATITSTSDIPGLTTTLIVPTGRRLRISLFAHAFPKVGGQTAWVYLKRDGTNLQYAYTTPSTDGVYVTAIDTPSAGSHTYKGTIFTSGGGDAGTWAAAAEPNYIMVEDIGAA